MKTHHRSRAVLMHILRARLEAVFVVGIASLGMFLASPAMTETHPSTAGSKATQQCEAEKLVATADDLRCRLNEERKAILQKRDVSVLKLRKETFGNSPPCDPPFRIRSSKQYQT